MSTYRKGSHPLAGRRLTPTEIADALRRGRGLPPLPRKSEAETWLENFLARASFEETARKGGRG